MAMIQDNQTFRTDIRSYSLGTERHQHDYVQVILPIRGRMELDIHGDLVVVEEGSYALLPPEVIHDFESLPQSKFLVVDADQKLLATSAASRVGLVQEPHVGIISSLATRFFTYFVSAVELGDFAFNEEQHRALSLLGLSIVANSDPTIERPQSRGLPRSLLNDIRDRKTGSIDQLARQHGLSRSVLYRRCREAYGLSPKQLEMDIRMKRAGELLCSTDNTVSSIAYEVGYENSSAFTMAFVKHFDLTPSTYRKAQKLK